MGPYPCNLYFPSPPPDRISVCGAAVTSFRKDPAPPNMEEIQRSLGNRVLNVSRAPIRPEDLVGRREGSPVMRLPRQYAPGTGYALLDHLLWKVVRAGTYMPRFMHQMASSSLTDSLVGGVSTALLTGVGVFAVKGLGGFRTRTAMNLSAFSVMIGFLGGLVGGALGLAQSAWRSARDLAPLFRYPAPEGYPPSGRN